MQAWPMQDVKTRWSELLESAQSQPQESTMHAKSLAIVMLRSMFDCLAQIQGSLVNFMRRSPLLDAEDVALERDTNLNCIARV